MSVAVTSIPKRHADSGGRSLESWKEIAAYLGRDVTTVRRWEKHEGMPVYRLLHHKLGSIYAYAAELDAWRDKRAPTAATDAPDVRHVAVVVRIGAYARKAAAFAVVLLA